MMPYVKTRPRSENISAPETATLFLVWQEPSDRALSGWIPFPSIRPGVLDDHSLIAWLREKVRASVAEEDDLARLREVH